MAIPLILSSDGQLILVLLLSHISTTSAPRLHLTKVSEKLQKAELYESLPCLFLVCQ